MCAVCERKPETGIPYVLVKESRRALAMKPAEIRHNLISVGNYFRAPREARRILREFGPDVVIGTGGYASFPLVKAAAKAGIPTAIHESNMDIGLEEVEQAASLVQEAVSVDAITIFGAQFDENLDDEIRVTVIATGFEKGSVVVPAAPQAPARAQAVPSPAVPVAPAAAAQQITAAVPEPLSTVDDPKPEEPEDDPFEDIFKIFNKRDD